MRNICKLYKDDQVYLFCKSKYEESIRFMYRDLQNLSLIPLSNTYATAMECVDRILAEVPTDRKIRIGFEYLQQFTQQGMQFDEAFYTQVGLPFNKRWDDFLVDRDVYREFNLYREVIGDNNNEYIFLHEDPSRGYIINREYITNKYLPVITPKVEYTNNIFDYLEIIENAKEVHCIDSSFKNMIDSVTLNSKGKLFYHLKLQNNVVKDYTYSNSRLNWEVIR